MKSEKRLQPVASGTPLRAALAVSLLTLALGACRNLL